MMPASETNSRIPHLPQTADAVAVRRGLAEVVVTATIIGIAIFLAFLALSNLSLRTDRSALATPINAAFANHTLDQNASWLHGDTGIGAHQYNDCLILFQALDDRAPRASRAVSPLSVPFDTDNSCGILVDFAAGKIQPPTRHYHQYLHASTTIARLLVPPLGVAGLRGLYKLALTLTLLAGIGYALLGLVRGQRTAENVAWLVVFLTLSRWFGLESFGQSLGHGPADLISLAFLLFLMRSSASEPLTPRVAVVSSAIFGALTMQFELLTGGLPFGLAIVVGALPLALPCQDTVAPVIVRSLVAYVSAIAATAIAKLALVAAIFDPLVLIELGRQLLFRTGLTNVASRDTPAGWTEFFGHTWAGLEALAPGMHLLVFGTLVMAIVAGGWGYATLRVMPDGGTRLRAVSLLGSMLVSPLWMVVFWQHTAEHAWFMDRILVWIIAAGGALFAIALVRRFEGQPE